MNHDFFIYKIIHINIRSRRIMNYITIHAEFQTIVSLYIFENFTVGCIPNIFTISYIVKRSLNGLMNSIADLFSPEVNSHSNRLREIEEEIKQQSNQELQEEQQIVNSKTRWDWGK